MPLITDVTRTPTRTRTGTLARTLRIVTAATALAAIAFASLAVTHDAHATLVIRMTDAQLAHDADAVVHGTVIAKRTESRDGQIFTLTSVKVTSWLKGAGNNTITVRQLGGIHNGIGQKVLGDADFDAGQEVVLFLRTGDGLYFLTGLAQSRFIVLRDTKLNRKVVVRPLDGLGLVEPQPSGKMIVIEPGSAPSTSDTHDHGNLSADNVKLVAQPVELNTFLTNIRAAVKAPAPEMPLGYRTQAMQDAARNTRLIKTQSDAAKSPASDTTPATR